MSKKPGDEGRLRNGIYRRGNSFYINVKANGERFRKSFGSDKRAAELALAEIRKQRAVARASDDWSGLEQVTKPASTIMFREVAETYTAERRHHKASSIATYNDILQTHLLPEFGKLQVRKVSEARIAQFQSKLAAKLSARRTNSIMQLLRSILKTCVRRKLVTDNAADGVDRLKEPQADINPLTKDELSQVLDNIDPHFVPLFVCLAWTGARPNEMQALRWSDVDFNRKEIHINKGRVRGKEGLPKSASGNRYVPMLPPVDEVLVQLKHGDLANLDGYVFLSKNGQPINKHLDRVWTRAIRKAGLRHRPSYQLRHTFASICLQEGVHPGWVAKVLGHSTQQTVFRHYARFINDTFKENEKRLAVLFVPSQEQQSAAM